MANYIIYLVTGMLLMMSPKAEATTQPKTISLASNVCMKTNTSFAVCDLKNEPAQMLEGKWDDVQGYKITGASSLKIQNQCNTNGKKLEITNSQNIFSELHESYANCTVDLRLDNCTATTLSDIFSQINIRNTAVKVLNLDGDQFDIQANSYVDKLNARTYTDKSTIIDSEVNLAQKIDIIGRHKLEIIRSNISQINQLIYNSKFAKASEIKDTSIGGISESGFQLFQGHLVLNDVIIDEASSNSIILYNGKLDLINVTFKSINKDSIVIQGTATLKFENVYINDNVIVSLELNTNQVENLKPLGTLLDDQDWKIAGIIFISLTILLTIIIIIVLLRCLCSSRQLPDNEVDKQKYPMTMVTAHSQETLPPPPTPIAIDPKRNENDGDSDNSSEDYYIDTENSSHALPPPPQLSVTQPPRPEKPPPSVPKISQQLANQSKPQFNSNQGQSKLNNSVNIGSAIDSSNENIYDECANLSPNVPTNNIKPSLFDKTKTTAPTVPLFPPKNNSKSVLNSEIDPPKGHQKPLLPGKKPDSSFLHKTSKPPPPPRDKNSALTPSANNSKLHSSNMFGGQRPPILPPPPKSMLSKSRDSDDFSDDTYDEI